MALALLASWWNDGQGAELRAKAPRPLLPPPSPATSRCVPRELDDASLQALS